MRKPRCQDRTQPQTLRWSFDPAQLSPRGFRSHWEAGPWPLAPPVAWINRCSSRSCGRGRGRSRSRGRRTTGTEVPGAVDPGNIAGTRPA
eukprot:5694364-Karenia_brevis.AAC.1